MEDMQREERGFGQLFTEKFLENHVGRSPVLVSKSFMNQYPTACEQSFKVRTDIANTKSLP